MWFRLWLWFKAVRQDFILLLIACRNPLTPRYLKVLFWGALLYFVSPADFIPDFLPGVGAVDDLTVVPAILYYINRMLPPEVRAASEERAGKLGRRMPYILAVAAVLLLLWLGFLVWGIYLLIK